MKTRKNEKLTANQKKVFDSFKKIDSKNLTKHVNEMLESLNKIFSNNNFYELMVYMHKNPLFSLDFPIKWEMIPNLKNSKIYCNSLSCVYPISEDVTHVFNCMKMTPKNVLECEKAIIKCFDNCVLIQAIFRIIDIQV